MLCSFQSSPTADLCHCYLCSNARWYVYEKVSFTCMDTSIDWFLIDDTCRNLQIVVVLCESEPAHQLHSVVDEQGKILLFNMCTYLTPHSIYLTFMYYKILFCNFEYNTAKYHCRYTAVNNGFTSKNILFYLFFFFFNVLVQRDLALFFSIFHSMFHSLWICLINFSLFRNVPLSNSYQ